MIGTHLLAALVVVVALGPADAGAGADETCSCGSAPLEERVAGADAAFVGVAHEVAATVATPAGDQDIWEFSVDRMLRGPAAERVNVGGGGADGNCSVEFRPGEQVGVLANWQAGHLVAGRCGLVDADVLLALGRGTDSTWATGIGRWVAGGAVVGAVGLILAVRRRRSIATSVAGR